MTTLDRWTEWTMASEAPHGWSHHGLAVLDDGSVVGYHPGEGRLLFFDPLGALVRSVDCGAVEAHDISVALDGRHLWLADCGHKLCQVSDGTYEVSPALEAANGQVVLVDLAGHVRRRIGTPAHPVYEAGGLFLPTGAVEEPRGVWIADGYGSNLVHLVNPADEVLLTIEGFDCPHGILVDRRRDEPLLYVAERGARRLCVYDLEGGFLRHVAEGKVLAPCSMTTTGDMLLVADLVGRVAVLDLHDEVVDYLGADREALARPGWPNALDDERIVVPELHAGLFNSPHGVAATESGTVYVTEWVLGGRWVRAVLR